MIWNILSNFVLWTAYSINVSFSELYMDFLFPSLVLKYYCVEVLKGSSHHINYIRAVHRSGSGRRPGFGRVKITKRPQPPPTANDGGFVGSGTDGFRVGSDRIVGLWLTN